MVEPPRKVLLLPLVVVEEVELEEVKLVIRRLLGEEEEVVVEYRLISVGAAAGMWIAIGSKAESEEPEPEDMKGSCRWWWW
jgi:hypothetical protein